MQDLWHTNWQNDRFVCQYYCFYPVSSNPPLLHTKLYHKTMLFRRTRGISFPKSKNINEETFLHCFSSVKYSQIFLSTSEEKMVSSRRNSKSYWSHTDIIFVLQLNRSSFKQYWTKRNVWAGYGVCSSPSLFPRYCHSYVQHGFASSRMWPNQRDCNFW